MAYRGVYPEPFFEELKQHTDQNPQLKRMAVDAIRLILENPFFKAKKLEGAGCYRKHVCGDNYRMVYDIYTAQNAVVFLYFRLKNNKTYKGITTYYTYNPSDK